MRTTYGVTTTNESVEPIVLTDDKAYVRTNITPIDEPGTDEMPGFKGFSYDETEYTKDEYIIGMFSKIEDTDVLLTALLGGAGNE